MSLVKVSTVKIGNNPGKFSDEVDLHVTFDVVEDLAEGKFYAVCGTTKRLTM